jgi:hypothetical protein
MNETDENSKAAEDALAIGQALDAIGRALEEVGDAVAHLNAVRNKNVRKLGNDLETVLNYWLYWMHDNEWRAEIVLATCRVMWPGRTFEVDEDLGDIRLDDVIDAATGESAEDLYQRDFGGGDPRRTPRPTPALDDDDFE